MIVKIKSIEHCYLNSRPPDSDEKDHAERKRNRARGSSDLIDSKR